MSIREDAIAALMQSWIDAKVSLIWSRSGAISKDLGVLRADALARARVLRLPQARMDFSNLETLEEEEVDCAK